MNSDYAKIDHHTNGFSPFHLKDDADSIAAVTQKYSASSLFPLWRWLKLEIRGMA